MVDRTLNARRFYPDELVGCQAFRFVAPRGFVLLHELLTRLWISVPFMFGALLFMPCFFPFVFCVAPASE